jgi:hypothetical protein
MSLIDFTASLFRDSRLADAFNDKPVQALRDAGLPDVTPADVHAMLPTVAESMPPDHPLQSWVLPAETSPVVGPEPIDPSVKHYYQLQPGDQVIDGVAGQTILRPDGTNDVILQSDEKVYVMQPGDQAIPGINGMVVQHPDGSVTDVGIDTTIVHEDEAYVTGVDPNSTKAEEIGEGGMDPRVTTTAEDLGGPDSEWTPHEEAMEWDNLEPAVLPTAPPELGLGEDIDPNVYHPDAPNASTLIAYDPQSAPLVEETEHYIPSIEETESSSAQLDSYSADPSSYESAPATESAGPEYFG